MEILKAAVLGIVQGLTEFFPVSSSGHLVITPFILNWDYIPVYYTVLLHFATLLALVTVFYREIGRIIKYFFLGIFKINARKNSYFKLAVFIIIGTVPAIFAGLFLEKFVENFFSRPFYVAIFLLVTALFLFFGEFAGKKIKNRKKIDGFYNNAASDFEETLTERNYVLFDEHQQDNYETEERANGFKQDNSKKFPAFLTALIIGIGQAVAIFPGISRSGTTISVARVFGIKRQACVKFSFLLSIPVIFGAFIFEFFDSYKIVAGQQSFTYIGMIVSFIFSYFSGLFAIKFLVKISRNRNFNAFALYCILLAILVFVLIYIRKI